MSGPRPEARLIHQPCGGQGVIGSALLPQRGDLLLDCVGARVPTRQEDAPALQYLDQAIAQPRRRELITHALGLQKDSFTCLPFFSPDPKSIRSRYLGYGRASARQLDQL